MSMLQIEAHGLWENEPTIAETESRHRRSIEYYFIYGEHYSISEFKNLFPTAVCHMVVCLPGWQWHVNEQVLPNLRLAYERAGGPLPSDEYLFPPPMQGRVPKQPAAVGAYGYLVTMSKESDALLHEYMKNQGYQRKLRMIQHPDELKHPRLIDGKLRLVVYIDLKYTRDLEPETKLFEPAEQDEETAMWEKGLNELVEAGAPRWYAEHIKDKMLSKHAPVEPFFIKRDLHLANRIKHWAFDEANKAPNSFFEVASRSAAGGKPPPVEQQGLSKKNGQMGMAKQFREPDRRVKRHQEDDSANMPSSKEQKTGDKTQSNGDSIADRIGGLVRSARRKKDVSYVPPTVEEDAK